jgi:hypothetical protein
MNEELYKINQCFTEIRTLENKKRQEAMKENKVFDASVINWCVVGERILYDLVHTPMNQNPNTNKEEYVCPLCGFSGENDGELYSEDLY